VSNTGNAQIFSRHGTANLLQATNVRFESEGEIGGRGDLICGDLIGNIAVNL
jgi:hypothetical protein